jgi:hypothetical protein
MWTNNRLSGHVDAGSCQERCGQFSRVASLPLDQNCSASQSRRFVAHEVRVISSKKEALQTLSIPKNVAGNPLTFRSKEIDESVDRGGKTLVNQRIILRQFGVVCCCRPKGSKLPDGVPALF